MRRQLVEDIRKKGITDEKVLAAIGALPRHFFLDKAFEELAYEDKALPIGQDQTISQPYTVAFQTVLLDVQKRNKVLEVGTGSGYQAAILAMLGARVYTVERQEALYKQAKAMLSRISPGNVRCFYRDGYKGLPEFAPFDRILVTAGADAIPEALLQQLRPGGILVIPVGTELQVMHKITRQADGSFVDEEKGFFRFVPFVKGLNRD
ncbi:MAG: protein-L-isoaspartate(D-aspartate) O-methyltransferase [Saprospiraceae bacterium]|nr:protein-L-isoaspartate(D-aspartate) O-methyltransferase [Saprospiraceae bacterium]